MNALAEITTRVTVPAIWRTPNLALTGGSKPQHCLLNTVCMYHAHSCACMAASVVSEAALPLNRYDLLSSIQIPIKDPGRLIEERAAYWASAADAFPSSACSSTLPLCRLRPPEPPVLAARFAQSSSPVAVANTLHCAHCWKARLRCVLSGREAFCCRACTSLDCYKSPASDEAYMRSALALHNES